MSTIGELLDALQGYDRRAKVSILVDTAVAADVVWNGGEATNNDIDTVEPIGCNLFDVQITIGGAR